MKKEFFVKKEFSELVTVGIEMYGRLGLWGLSAQTTDITWCITVTSSRDMLTPHKKLM